jgi:hypothetical protein
MSQPDWPITTKKIWNHGDSSKLNVLFRNFYSSPLNWPIFIGKSRTTFAISYQIKLRCYWEQGTHSEQGKLALPLVPKIQRSNIVAVECMLCLLIGCMFFSFSPRTNGQATNIHNWCWWTIFLQSAWISQHLYLQKENWYLTKTIPCSLGCREIENPTQDYQFEIWNYFKAHHQLILDFNSFII